MAQRGQVLNQFSFGGIGGAIFAGLHTSYSICCAFSLILFAMRMG
jgi:hypothetical protein